MLIAGRVLYRVSSDIFPSDRNQVSCNLSYKLSRKLRAFDFGNDLANQARQIQEVDLNPNLEIPNILLVKPTGESMMDIMHDLGIVGVGIIC